MPWMVGIDEAGYGPNLGPFVMTSVACRVPEDLAGCDLWEVLAAAVRREPACADGRLLVEDSKVVYSTTRGLAELETSVLATLRPWPAGEVAALERCLEGICPAALAELRQECWYTGRSLLPLAAQADGWADAAERFRAASSANGIVWGLMRSVVVCPPRFNQVLDQWGSKGAVLAQALRELLALHGPPAADDEPVAIVIDKHGGRNTYFAQLQQAFADGFVVAHEESAQRSVYSVQGLGRDVRLRFQPRADAEHFCVALASMVSKYLREVLMAEFNQFWQAQVPGLKATAGYPGDAARFLAAIRPAAARLGVPETVLWRRK